MIKRIYKWLAVVLFPVRVCEFMKITNFVISMEIFPQKINVMILEIQDVTNYNKKFLPTHDFFFF